MYIFALNTSGQMIYNNLKGIRVWGLKFFGISSILRGLYW